MQSSPFPTHSVCTSSLSVMKKAWGLILQQYGLLLLSDTNSTKLTLQENIACIEQWYYALKSTSTFGVSTAVYMVPGGTWNPAWSGGSRPPWGHRKSAASQEERTSGLVRTDLHLCSAGSYQFCIIHLWPPPQACHWDTGGWCVDSLPCKSGTWHNEMGREGVKINMKCGHSYFESAQTLLM